MVDLRLLLCLVLLNSIDQSGHAVGQLITCGEHVTEGADVIEDDHIVMSVSHPLMANDIELVPNLEYDVSVSSSQQPDVPVVGVFLTTIAFPDNVTDVSERWTPSANTTCPLDANDFQLPITVKWTCPDPVDSCITLRFGIFYNSSAKQFLSTTLCKPTGCFNYTTSESGIVTSPQFPQTYPDDANCSYYIMVNKGEIIDLQFQYLDLERPYSSRCFDQVEVYYNNVTTGAFCGNWTRQDLKQLRYLAKDYLKIRFNSDNKLNSDGFLAVYQTVSLKECSHSLYNLSGTISSPSYPQYYFPNARCLTKIVLPSNYRILIKVIDLDLEMGDEGGCMYDRLHIYDSQLNTSGKIWCGSVERYAKHELRYESSASVVTVDFESDNLNEYKGFYLSYLGVPSCHNETFSIGNGTLSSVNYPFSYPNGQECFYTISISDDSENIELTFDMLNTESVNDIRYRNHLCNKDYVEVFDGRTSHRVCGNWSGQEHLLMFRSTGNSLVFKFVSDEQTTRPGFYAKWRTVRSNGDVPCVSTWLDTGSSCFEIIYLKQTWNDSDIDCRSRGGHLATITDLATELFISRHLQNSNCTRPNDAFWIGANDQLYESDFYWTDGSKVQFSDWFDGWPHYSFANHQPSDDGLSQEDCVELRRTFNYPYKGQGTTAEYRWNDRDCRVKNPYVCQCYRNGNKPPNKEDSLSCDQTLRLSSEESSVTVTSPGYPDNYSNFMECTIAILAPQRYSLVVDFSDLSIEESDNCDYDYLSVTPFPENSSLGEEVKRLCGDWSRKPKLLRTFIPTNAVFLHFSSDHSFRYPGFNATISVINETDMCGRWILSAGRCLTPSTNPVHRSDAEAVCQETGDSRLNLKASLKDFFLVSSHVMTNATEEVRFWYDIEDGGCRAAIVNVTEKYGNLSLPNDVVIQNVSCDDMLYAVCYKNKTEPDGGQVVDVITAHRGQLTTTGYPNVVYNDNINRIWKFKAANGSRILITLLDVDLEYQDSCLYDFLEFKYTLPEGRFCGNTSATHHFLSRNNKADVRLESDYGYTGRGFSLSWVHVDTEECTNKILTDDQGAISSFNFPFAFPDAMQCQIVIQGCNECRVLVELEFLALPAGQENFLKVFISDKLFLTYRNNSSNFSLPLRLLSQSINMTLIFKATSLPENFGFRGTFKQLHYPITVPTEVIQVKPEAPTFITSLNSPLPYPSAINQKTVYRAPIGHTLHLTFDSVNLEFSKDCSRDVITVTDVSIGNSEKQLYTLCRNRTNSTYLTTAAVVSLYNRLELHFVSADEYTKLPRGFSATIEAKADPAYMNKTAALGGNTFDSCKEEPCINGGACSQMTETEAKCLCPGYFTGLFCQVTHCQLSPCDRGECVLTNTSYYCNCSLGYWGPRCSLTQSRCRSVFCGGKGECVGNDTATPECRCDNFWEGAQCREPIADAKMTLAIGQRLLGEPIWIGLIVILSVLLAFGIFYIIRRKFGKHFTCCDIKIKKDEKTDTKANPSETPTPLIIQSSFSEKKSRRCSIPPPFVVPPVIAITKAEESCASTPGYARRTDDVAARFFASYKEAERTPISAPVAVDFNKTTATSMASDSDDNSIVGGLVGGTLAFAGTRLRNEEIRRSEANKMLRATSYLQTPRPSPINNRDKMKRSHSTGPFLVRQASLYDDVALSQKSLSAKEPSTEHLFPTVIVSNETQSNVDEDENSSIQIYLDEPEEQALEGAVGSVSQAAKSCGSFNSSLRHKVSSWRSVAVDDCQSHFELTRKERAKCFSRSASADQLKEQHASVCKSRSRSEMNSFESGISCDCSKCKRRCCTEGESSAKSRSSSCRCRSGNDVLSQSCSCDGDRQHGRLRHVKRRHHKSHRKLHSCSSIGHNHICSKSMTRASSTESEQYHKKSYASHKRAKANSKRSSKRDILKALDVENSDKDADYARRELFMKFFSQEVGYSSENTGFNDDENVFKFPDSPRPTDDVSDTAAKTPDKGNTGATCSVIIYNSSARDNSRHVNISGSEIVGTSVSQEVERVLSKDENDDSAICSSEATTSSDSFKSHKEEKKALKPSSSLLTVTTDTDSALSSAPKSFQASPYHDARPDLNMETQPTYIHDMKVKDSAYQTKQSSVDVGISSLDFVMPVERLGEMRRKLSLPTTKSEESHVTQRLHQAACKLFLLQQRVRRNRFSKDSAVHTISEDEYHQMEGDEEAGTDIFNHRRFARGQMIPLRHLDHIRNDKTRLSVQLVSTATPVSDADQGSEVGEISI